MRLAGHRRRAAGRPGRTGRPGPPGQAAAAAGRPGVRAPGLPAARPPAIAPGRVRLLGCRAIMLAGAISVQQRFAAHRVRACAWVYAAAASAFANAASNSRTFRRLAHSGLSTHISGHSVRHRAWFSARQAGRFALFGLCRRPALCLFAHSGRLIAAGIAFIANRAFRRIAARHYSRPFYISAIQARYSAGPGRAINILPFTALTRSSRCHYRAGLFTHSGSTISASLLSPLVRPHRLGPGAAWAGPGHSRPGLGFGIGPGRAIARICCSFFCRHTVLPGRIRLPH